MSMLRQRVAEIERQAATVEDAQRGVDGKTKKYAELFKDAKMKEAAAGSSADDIRREKEALDSRERKLKDMQANLQSEIKRLNAENRAILEGTGVRQRTAAMTNAAYVARQEAANSLRDGIYNTLEQHGVEGSDRYEHAQ